MNIFTKSLLSPLLSPTPLPFPLLLLYPLTLTSTLTSNFFVEFHLRSLYFTILQLKSTTHGVKLWKLEFKLSLPSFNIACSKTKLSLPFLYIAVLQRKSTTSSLIFCMLNIRMETSIRKLCVRSQTKEVYDLQRKSL